MAVPDPLLLQSVLPSLIKRAGSATGALKIYHYSYRFDIYKNIKDAELSKVLLGYTVFFLQLFSFVFPSDAYCIIFFSQFYLIETHKRYKYQPEIRSNISTDRS